MKLKQKRAAKSEVETDIKKLLHELQVHQIELEMQNEELRQANETTEAALKKYTLLYDYNSKDLSYVYIEGVVTGDERKCLLSIVDISEIKQQSDL